MLDYQNDQFKSLEELKEIAPSIFTKKGSDKTSSKYTHIPTDRVIKDLELLGWGVVDAKEVNARQDKGYQKHLVVFRNPDVSINKKSTNVDGDVFEDIVFPQILVTNSHDGKNSFKFQAGLYRMVCENGLVIADQQFEDYTIRHMGYDFEALQNVIKDMISNLDLTVESMNKMRKIELDENQQFEFAKKLLDIRVEGTDNLYREEQIGDILVPQRKEDFGDDLWSVFNRVQENIVEGNFKYYNAKTLGTERQARPIKNFKQDMDVNKKLFSAALEYAA
tara:strand:- start:319 stop:1152 length:834 start_codon:yes stop_codon:yes gene_type:complete